MAACQQTFAEELVLRDEGVCLSVTEGECVAQAPAKAATERLIAFLATVPEGVCSRNLAYPGLMESSVNTGVVFMEDGKYVVVSTIRSGVKSKKYYLYDRIVLLCKAMDIELTIDYDLPEWPMKVSDEILDLCKKIYPECSLIIEEATNECGIFCDNMPQASVISLQCPYQGAHSTTESISLSDIGKYYTRLKEFITHLT